MVIKLLKDFYSIGSMAILYNAGTVLDNVHDTGLGFYDCFVDVIGETIHIPVEDAAIIL